MVQEILHNDNIRQIKVDDYTSATTGKPITITMPKILPCLRCGSNKTHINVCYNEDELYKEYQISCENGHKWDEWLDTEAEAIAAWNERPIYVMKSAATV